MQIRAYLFPSILLSSILLGGLTGYFLGPQAESLKPLGDIFLNLIFTTIVPLIFFSVSSAIAKTKSSGKVGKTFLCMIIVFIFTSIIASIFTIFIVKLFPPAQGVYLNLTATAKPEHVNLLGQLAAIFTVSDFTKLLSHENMLALIIFSILVGFASASIKESRGVLEFLHAGEKLSMRIFALIMYYAPIGFFAYFAVLVSELGPQVMSSYLRVAIIYYAIAFVYFIAASTIYAYLAGRFASVKLFWRNALVPSITALATCSSAASIPANLEAAQNMRVSPEIAETVIPLGAIIHKDGSVIGGIIKIAFLFGIFHLDFTGTSVLLMALGVSLLVGTIMGAIPSGGMLGELLILHVYGFPPTVLMAIAAISIIIDPPATLINVTSNLVSSMMIDKLVKTKTSV